MNVPCKYPAPNRKSVELPNGMWGTREWEKGEKSAYTREVLRRPITEEELREFGDE